MPALKLVDIPEPQSIREEAFRSLIKNLGISKAAFFARECMSQKEDYVKLKDEIFANQSLDEMFQEIQLQRKSKQRSPRKQKK